MVIGIDFDGTCVTHEFPLVGKEIGAERILKLLVANGHQLVLFTMRSDNKEGDYLTEAVEWFKKRNIPLYGINTNTEQHLWTSSPKAYCQLYIDDCGLGIPLKKTKISERPYVDWLGVEYLLLNNGIL